MAAKAGNAKEAKATRAVSKQKTKSSLANETPKKPQQRANGSAHAFSAKTK